jgi:hypothetical protein
MVNDPLRKGKESCKHPLQKIEEEIMQYEARLNNVEDDLVDRNIDLDTFR